MFNHGLLRGFLTCAVTALFLFPCGVHSQQPPEEEGDMLMEAVVTGMRVSQGGAQDINFFRGEVAFARIPHPDTLTAEGLMSEHDIVFTGDRQLPAVVLPHGRSQPRGPDRRAAARAISPAWALPPTSTRRNGTVPRLNLVAVVDKSGSMDGEPLELVRQSLTTLANQLRPGDQLTIVLYGDTRARAPAHDGRHPLWRRHHSRVHRRHPQRRLHVDGGGPDPGL